MVRVIRMFGRNIFWNDSRVGVFINVDYFCIGIGLLEVVGNGYWVKFIYRIIFF